MENHDTITYAETYNKPVNFPFEVMDETIYSFCLSLSDGSQYSADSAGPGKGELEDFFYCPAEKSN